MAYYGNLDVGSSDPLINAINKFFKDNPHPYPEQTQQFMFELLKEYPNRLNDINRLMDERYIDLRNSIYEGVGNGSMSGTEALNFGGRTGLTGYDAGLSDYLSHTVSQENAAQEYEREIEARDTSLSSTIKQLQDAGMNPGSVLTLGGSSVGNIGQATSNNLSAAGLAQQRKINDYNQKQAMTRQLISMVGSLGSAAIGGSTYGLARSAAIGSARATAGAAKAALRRPIIKDKGHEDDPDSWYIF